MTNNEPERTKRSAAAHPASSWLSVVALLGTLTALVLMWSLRAVPPGTLPEQTQPQPAAPIQTRLLPLSPQECVTECQAQQTDCIQDCDGRVSCEAACVGVGESCVARCRHPGDAGVRRARRDGDAGLQPRGVTPPPARP